MWRSIGKYKETDEENHVDCVEERFQLVRVKFDGDRKALEMGYCSINMLDESELELV